MSSHQMELDNGHIILIDNGKRFIIDTGTDLSFADASYTLTIAGEDFDVSANTPMGLPVTMEGINNMGLLAKPVNGFLGLNVLANRKSWEFDFKNQTIYVDEPIHCSYSDSVPYTYTISGINFKATVNDQVCTSFLDTGTFIAYAISTLISNVPACGTIDDCNPIIGPIHTTKHEVQIKIGNTSFKQYAAKMPPCILANMLNMFNIKLVMGVTPLDLDAFCINAKNNTLMFAEH